MLLSAWFTSGHVIEPVLYTTGPQGTILLSLRLLQQPSNINILHFHKSRRSGLADCARASGSEHTLAPCSYEPCRSVGLGYGSAS